MSQPPLPSPPHPPAFILIPEVTPCISAPLPSLKTGTIALIFPGVRLSLGRIMDLKKQLPGEAPCMRLCLLSPVQAQACVDFTPGRLASSHCRLCHSLCRPLSAEIPGPWLPAAAIWIHFSLYNLAVHSSTRTLSEPQPAIPDPSGLHLPSYFAQCFRGSFLS